MAEHTPSNIDFEIDDDCETVYIRIDNKKKQTKCKLWFENILEKYNDHTIKVNIDDFSMKYYYAMVYDAGFKYSDGPNPYYEYTKKPVIKIEKIKSKNLIGKTIEEAQKYVNDNKVYRYQNGLWGGKISTIYVCIEDGKQLSLEEYYVARQLNVEVKKGKIIRLLELK